MKHLRSFYWPFYRPNIRFWIMTSVSIKILIFRIPIYSIFNLIYLKVSYLNVYLISTLDQIFMAY